jgi:hypothetical protein
MYWLKIFIKRVIKRFINALKFTEMWNWQHESCDECGACHRISTSWENKLWLEVNNGKSDGYLCPECVIKIAQKNKIKINIEDIKRMCIFNPDGDCVVIIKPSSCENAKDKS